MNGFVEAHFGPRLFSPGHGFQNIELWHVQASISREILIRYSFVIAC